MFVKIVQVSSDEGMGKQSKFVGFSTVWLVREEQNILIFTHVYILSCKHISRPIRARAYYLSYL